MTQVKFRSALRSRVPIWRVARMYALTCVPRAAPSHASFNLTTTSSRLITCGTTCPPVPASLSGCGYSATMSTPSAFQILRAASQLSDPLNAMGQHARFDALLKTTCIIMLRLAADTLAAPSSGSVMISRLAGHAPQWQRGPSVSTCKRKSESHHRHQTRYQQAAASLTVVHWPGWICLHPNGLNIQAK